MNKQISTLLAILIILSVAGVAGASVLFLAQEEREVKKEDTVEKDVESEKEDKEDIFVDTIMVPVIGEPAEDVDYDDTQAMEEAREKGDFIGCGDKVYYIEKEIEPTNKPLEAIYLELFKGDEIVEGTDYSNPLSYHIKERSIETEKKTIIVEPLEFNEVVLDGNKARIYLSGEYATIGTCEPPRTEAVLIFAALQYDWIDDAIIYLNNEKMEFVHGGEGD